MVSEELVGDKGTGGVREGARKAGRRLRDVPAEGGQRFISFRHGAHIAPNDAHRSVDYWLQILAGRMICCG